ncbi:MAG: EAL domain-containing protein [Desulfuromonadales bacterium]|nr:EAL domain-containing protein [Desulfuromonadales bacterium]
MEHTVDKFFLGRQPILNRYQEIIGFELLFRATKFNAAEFTNYSHASASVISNVLSEFGLEEVLGGKLGFINVNMDVLFSEGIELLPIEQTVIELLEIIELNEHVVERCRELRKLGFKIALDDHEYSEDNSELYEVVNIIKIDILQSNIDELPDILRKFKNTRIKMLAEKVETVEQFEACFKMGFDYFQGYFFERPMILNRNRIDFSGMAMLKLLQQLIMDAPIAEIEQTFKENPSLSYNLLRLVNSVGIGLRNKIKNLRHAIILLGVNHLRRWVQLSLFAVNDRRGLNHPLLEMAVVRGRMMEILVDKKRLQDDLAEAAFMTGILSLLDVLFEVPMSEIVESLHLTDDVTNALLTRQGKLGMLLTLTEKVETTDFDAVILLLDQCNITMDQLLSAQVESFGWRASVIAQ